MASRPNRPLTPQELRRRLLDDLHVLQLAVSPAHFDAALQAAESEGLSHLDFLQRLLGTLADQRRENRIARRLREARFRDPCTLETFDWDFNADVIDRVQVEELATADFVRRHVNIVVVGQSGVGKSHLVQSWGRCACVQGFRVRYTTSAELITKLKASLADHTLTRQLRGYSSFDLLIIDEFGFDRLERVESREAAHLLYKVVDARNQKRSTMLVTNLDFPAWGEYLGDAPLAMAFLDRLVDGAMILKIPGKSYRAHRATSTRKPEKHSKKTTP
jgi:DNA replication protein DnaC